MGDYEDEDNLGDVDYDVGGDDLGGYESMDEMDYLKTSPDEGRESDFLKAGKEDEPIADDAYGKISMEAEWRDFGDGVSKSRVGIARANDIEEDLGTIALDDTFKSVERRMRSPADIYRGMCAKIMERYELHRGVYDDALRIMQMCNRQKRGIRYKNPAGIMFAIMCIKNGKIDEEEFDKVFDKMAKEEKMLKEDLLRYIFFVKSVRGGGK